MRCFSRAKHDALVANASVAVTWESAFLVDPSGAVWTPTSAGDRRGPLLKYSDAGDGRLSEAGGLSER